MGILAAKTAPASTSNHISTITPAMTAAFTPTATACLNNQLTMLENQAYNIWLNYPLPVPHSTFSDCYPSQFMSSFLASAAGTTQAAFSPLVCPGGYTTVSTSWPAASNYIACCPSSYGLAPNDTAPSTRPAYNAKCYSNLSSGATLQMTLYGSSSLSNTNAFSVSASTMQAYAIPYEGYADKAVGPISIPAATSSSSSVAPAVTYTVFAAEAFTPNSVSAHVGDLVVFQFQNGNHSLTESTYGTPCEALAGGADSGFMPNLDNQVPYPQYTLKVNTTDPLWFYSGGDGDCASGMTFGLNPNSTETEAQFQNAAEAQASATAKNKSSGGGTSTGVKIGVSIGVILFALLVFAALGAFFLHRRRQARSSMPPGYETAAELDLDASEPKGYGPAEMKPPVPAKNYELSTSRADSRHELASPAVELPGSKFSEHVDEPPLAHERTFYTE